MAAQPGALCNHYNPTLKSENVGLWILDGRSTLGARSGTRHRPFLSGNTWFAWLDLNILPHSWCKRRPDNQVPSAFQTLIVLTRPCLWSLTLEGGLGALLGWGQNLFLHLYQNQISNSDQIDTSLNERLYQKLWNTLYDRRRHPNSLK